jgi:hypothetical protein
MRVLTGLFLVLLVGCASPAPKNKLSKDTTVFIKSEAKDLLFAQAVVDQSTVPGVSRRVEKYVGRTLNDRGIQTTDLLARGNANLTVNIDNIETVTATSIGMWAPIVRQQPKIRYTVTFLSPEGETLLKLEGEADDESLEKVTRRIGEDVGRRIARCFK